MKKRILFLTCLLGSLLPFKVNAATDGISIQCENDGAMLASSKVACRITGHTSSAVSGLQFRLTSDSLVTISNIQVASIWQGDGGDGNIGVYTDTNKTGTFDIATFTLTANEAGGTAHIYANDIVFSDASFNIHSYGNQTKNIVVQNKPSNPAFTDFNFYKCVIDSYNGSIYPRLPYTTNLTDAQLSNITDLQCNGSVTSDADKITNVSGIEKLTGVRNMDLSNHKIVRIDVSNNTTLDTLNLSNNQLTNFAYGSNSKIRVLNINNNAMQFLDIAGLKSLHVLKAMGNPFTNLNILENSHLQMLELDKRVNVLLTRTKSNSFPIQNNTIKNIPLDTKPETIVNNFYFKNVNYNYTFINPQGVMIEQKQDGNTFTNLDEKLTTGTKYKIQFNSYIEEYTLMIKGDVTGTGEVSISDVARLYQFYKKKIPMDQVYILAGDIDNDGTVQVNDIAKLYQFYKKKIPSLN